MDAAAVREEASAEGCERCFGSDVVCNLLNLYFEYLQIKRSLQFTDTNTTVATSIGLSEVCKVTCATTEYRLVGGR